MRDDMHIICIAIVTIGLGCLVSMESSADIVTLRTTAYVKGPSVLLGDIADIEGEHAATLSVVAVTPAAMPGMSKRFTASLVESRLDSAGFNEGIELRGPNRVVATTRHLEVSDEMIAEDLRQYIQLEMPWSPQDTIVDIVAPAQGLVVSDGDVTLQWRSNPEYNYLGNGTFRGELLVDGQIEKSFYAKARIETYDFVLVAARSLSRGDRLSSGNVRLEKRALSTLTSGAYFSPDDVRGYVAKASIFQGQVITDRKVTAPVLVKRNQSIVVETTIGSLTIQSRAKAMNSGAAGETVVCQSLSSKEEFTGVLQSDGVLVVE